MKETRIKISSIIENQLPQFVKEEFPLVSEFLSQYYISLENQGGTSDILQNIDEYIKIDNLTNLIDSTSLVSDVTFFDSTINVLSTAGFPDSYGLLLIDSEIITYTSKTSTTFEGCIRGFSGVTSYKGNDELVFTESQIDEHKIGTTVNNLSILFLKEFLNKVKKQFTPGFEDRELYSELDQRLFIKQSVDFYSSKGTDNSFKILFKALYGENVEVIRPRDYLICPSDAQYRVTSDLVVQVIQGNPEEIVNLTLKQDKTDFINQAQGTITKVEKIRRNSKDYYILSIDSDYDKDIEPVGTIYGNFSIHPKTQLVNSASSGSITLEVDSTVGFPDTNGTLIVDLENGTSLTIFYTSKTLNQFLGCTGISQNIPASTEIKLDAYAYAYNLNQEQVKVRILGVLSNLNIPDNTSLFSKDDIIKIKTLGINLKDYKSNNWFFNIPVKYEVNFIQKLSDGVYRINLYYEHSFKVGDSATLISSSDDEFTGIVNTFINEKSFSVSFGDVTLNTNFLYKVRKNIAKVSTQNYPSVNQYTSNVQNIYYDEDESLYVASPSLPTYLNKKLNINDRSVVFSGTFEGDILELGQKHGFYTGDSIVYKPTVGNTLGISTGVYFIKVVDETKVKLSRSRSNIFNNYYVNVSGKVANAKFELTNFTYRNLDTQLLESQKIIRKISEPQEDGNTYETNPGLTGIFVNGVELLNYKSKDNVYFGPIEKIIPVSPGSDYDVINPPTLTISDGKVGLGTNAKGICNVVGQLERIDIIEPGFDYLEEPIITITGGNGNSASAKANLINFNHEVSFNSQDFSGLVQLNPTNTISFPSYHKFRDAEEVVYVTNGQTSVGGISTNSTYFVSVQDAYTIKLYKSVSDVISGINTIQLTSYGTGTHSFKSKNIKKKIGSITIENKGSGYENKLTSTTTGINTSLNIITINNHGYSSGEIITYNPTETPVGGLSSSTTYYVTKINDNQFKLSNIGNSGITTSFYYDTKQYINLTSIGSGIHQFNYPEIKVSVKGRIGVSTLTSQDFNATIQPIFRGEIKSVFVQSEGSNYGSEEIINYNRQPSFELYSGSGIQLKPVISNGKIVDVIINSPGSGYNSPPNLEVYGSGVGAVLTPVLSNGTLIGVKIINSGSGYDDKNTTIIAISAGSDAKFEAQIKSWKINLVQRLLLNKQISDDDGILDTGLNNDYGLEYTHAYAPRYLRTLVQGATFKNGEKVYVSDLQYDVKEQDSNAHSPILGWAYDGNPIYGPYGFSSKTGGYIKSLSSGYQISLKENRPNTSLYPEGFFIEDYTYFENGDLDEHNGRFCITPEYPNGTYAYFTTIGEIDSSFGNYKKPIFPYVIGNTYKSKPVDFNFNFKSNQDYIDINQTNWRRNTTPYGLLNTPNSYDYLLNPNDIKIQNSIVETVSSGSIDSIEIISSGKDYKVGDKVVFSSDSGYGANAKVSSIKGKEVSQISVATSTFENVRFYPFNQEFIGFTPVPHNFLNNDLITVTGQYDYKKSGNIKVNNNSLTLTSGIGSAQYTGLVTYFNVSGNLSYPNISENDIYQIGEEQVKVLNVDLQSSRIRVLRNQNSTSGLVSYFSGTQLTEQTRKFSVNFGISSSYNFDIDRELYFNPKESVGLGTTSGVGIASTIYFSNPGAGITQITIPTQTLYLPNHNLNTGDSLSYSANGGTAVSVSTNGTSSFQLTNNSIVYAYKFSNDLIGISTVRVGLSSVGTFTNGILYFTSVGTGNTHSFKTNYTNTLTAQITKNVVTVSTAETHGLNLLDNVIIDVKPGISTTVVVKYDDYNRRLLINPRIFSSIDTVNNIITINNHGYYTGQKILYTSSTPATGLVNEGLYYVVAIDSNNIRLSNSYYDATKTQPNVINITTSSPGYVYAVNPPLNAIKNQSIIFDLSDSSLSTVSAGASYSAFDFRLYKDEGFTQEFDSTKSSSTFEIIKSGRVGIDTYAKVTLTLNELVPSNLYYNLIPINLNVSSDTKKQIVKDDEVISSNKISVVDSTYNGTYKVIGITSDSFKYNILETPESSFYSDGVEYYTNSIYAKGPIQQISLIDKGKNYKTVPEITSIISDNGSDAVLNPISHSIGRIKSTEIQDIGFDYSLDYSVRPSTKLPDILILEPLSSFAYIGISSFGKGYNSPPTLIVIDGLTNKVIQDVELSYSNGDSRVTIIRNSRSINNVTPKIIPTNNSNGIKIKNISFNNITKDVTVTLNASYSNYDDFPFYVGGKILIEGTSVGISTIGKGYNSSNYGYAVFTITSFDPKLGGTGAFIVYNLSSYLNEGEFPGDFNSYYSSGKVILQDDFPIFNPILKANDFYDGEIVDSPSASGTVEFWNSINHYLKVSTTRDFKLQETVIGKTSGSVGIIKNIISYDGDYSVNSSSFRRKGWNRETGFLNNSFQRIHDSDYYQYFSYSLKSQKDFNTWGDSVSALNHTSGFKKFSDLVIESEQSNSGISTEQNNGDFVGVADFSKVIDLNCTYDFDLVRENNLFLDGYNKSDEIIFNSRPITDYIESIGNRVLLIDDISSQFNSNPRSTKFSIVDDFILSDFRSKKYIATIQDKKYQDEQQISLISLIYDDSFGYLNQYGLTTSDDLGFFDFNISGNSGNLLFYPVKTKYNNYYVELFSFSLNDSISGVGTVNLGNSVKIDTNTVTIPTGTNSPTTVVSIATSYRASKVLVQIGASDSSYYESDELSIIHDGSNVELLNYGELTTDSFTSKSSSGIGTYNAYISGSFVNIDLVPNDITSVDYNVNAIKVLLSNDSVSGIGTQIIGGSSVNSSSVSIASTNNPISNTIASYSNLYYNSSYAIISIKDKTNSQYQMSEFLVLTNLDDCYTTEFGVIQTNSTLGIITSGISGTKTNIYFTPIPNIDVDVKVFQVNNGLKDESLSYTLINGSLNYDYGEYVGTDNDIKKDFDLRHKNLPIFQRYFDASNSNIVSIAKSTITIPYHYFVTGEEIVYSYPERDSSPISIATTTIPGIGITDKLPSTLYVVKINDRDIKVSATASDALKTIPNTLSLTSVGIGSSHIFTSKNQNKKALISIDNLIQSPIASTAVTSVVTKNITTFDSEIYVTDVKSIYGGDLIKVENEIMKVTSVGISSTNSISVLRGWVGTIGSAHSTSTLVTKVLGNYNIIDNKIYFSEAPYGKVPIFNPINRPDEQDYTGIATGSSFSGRVFLRSGIIDDNKESYSNNYIFDDISDQFTGKQKSFNLKSNGTNVTGISTDNAIVLINEIFQGPNSQTVINEYSLNENAGITSITFTGTASSVTYDVNTASIPRGGIILSIGSTQGFGYQPLVAAGGTAIVSVAGTIKAISIGNSGSGYRPGIQKVVNVGVATSSIGTPNIQFIGTATVSNGRVVSVAITNPGSGYTSSNPPVVIFDSPLSYSNIPLIYSSKSPSGIGTGAMIDIVVGQGSSVISFELKNLGYGYKQGEILTVSIGGTSGIQTNTSLAYSEFQVSVDKTQSDKFSAWTVGSFEVIDPIDFLFDGNRKVFPILINGNQTTIISKKFEVQATLLVFINDVLQVPGEGYIFKGGSTIRFTEAPNSGDKSRILFYKGTGDVDTQNVEVLQTIKVGDSVTINSDDINLQENERIVTEVVSSDDLNTNLYSGPGVSGNENLLRPLTWCRQTEDMIINGNYVAKDRQIYEPYIQPVTNIIQNVGIGSTLIFVESVKTFFDSEREYSHNGINEKPQNKIIIISQESLVTAAGTAIVSSAGTITSINITDGGLGYDAPPIVSISNPISIGSTGKAEVTTSIINGSVTSVSIDNCGFGYIQSQPPSVLFESPTLNYETIDNISYSGDFGVITGIKTTSVGVAYTGLVFDFFIPLNSPLRDNKIVKVGVATTGISGIQTGYYFLINNSNVGGGLTSLDSSGNIVGIGTSFINNVYQVAAVSIAQTAVPGIGITNVTKVTVSLSSYNNLSRIGYSNFYGEYSWGLISTPIRKNPKNFTSYAKSGGISTSPIIQRYNKLKYIGYSTT